MLIPSFSTVACPEWTADKVFEHAAAAGYLGVELRTFGAGSRGFASDPALIAPDKLRALADRTGVQICSIASSCRFDQPVWPPVLGYAITDTERSIREAKWHIDLAIMLECPLVRVFAFEPPPRETTRKATARIAERLNLVVAHAHRTGVRVMIENGGRYPTAARLMSIVDEIDSPLLGVCYNVAVAHAAGESPLDGVNVLGERLLSLRLKDFSGNTPCMIGEGRVPVAAAVSHMIDAGIKAPVIFEWDKAWFSELAPAETVLKPAAGRMFDWIKASAAGSAAAREGAHV